mgnify:CR=1 FL=1
MMLEIVTVNLSIDWYAKPTVMGLFKVERVVTKRIHGRETAYFIQWKNYSPEENTKEPADHLPEELIAAFENRSVDTIRADECRERLAVLFEKSLKSPLACNETITIRHEVLRVIFPGLPSDLRGTPYLVSEEELISAGLGSSLKKCLTVTVRHFLMSNIGIPDLFKPVNLKTKSKYEA